MYANTKTGPKAIDVAAPTYTPEGQVLAFRTALNGLLATSDVITDQEYQAAAQNIARCESLPTLQKWYRNCVREIAQREELAPETALVDYATATQKEEVLKLANSVYILRAEKVKALLGINLLTYPQAKKLIADLWGKILDRQEQAAEGYDTAHGSFSDAA